MFDKARPCFKKRIKFNGQWKKLRVSDNLGFKKRKTTYLYIFNVTDIQVKFSSL